MLERDPSVPPGGGVLESIAYYNYDRFSGDQPVRRKCVLL